MLSLILLCLIIYVGAYACLAASKQPMDVKPVRSFDDFFE